MQTFRDFFSQKELYSDSDLQAERKTVQAEIKEREVQRIKGTTGREISFGLQQKSFEATGRLIAEATNERGNEIDISNSFLTEGMKPNIRIEDEGKYAR